MEYLVTLGNSYMLEFTSWLNMISGGNQFLSGALLVTITGALVWFRKLPSRIYRMIKYRIMTGVILTTYGSTGNNYNSTSENDIFRFCRWYNNSWWFKLVRNPEMVLSLRDYNTGKYIKGYLSNGTYPFVYKRRLYFVTVEIVKEDKGNQPSKSIILQVSTFGLVSGSVDKLFYELYELYKPTGVNFGTMSPSGSVDHKRVREKSSKSSLYQDDGSIELIFSKFDRFLNSKEYYLKHEIPYRESFMLHGKPGTGKTSIIRALSKHFNVDVMMFPISSINDSFVKNLSNWVDIDGRPMIVVIEDIDSLKASKRRDNGDADSLDKVPDPDELVAIAEKKNAELAGSVTDAMSLSINNSDFLNSLDGLIPLENIIFIFTTNHLEKIDPAIVRKGRVNNIIEIKEIGQVGVNRFIKDRYDVDNYLDGREVSIPICDLQYMFTSNMTDYDGFKNDLENYLIKGNDENEE